MSGLAGALVLSALLANLAALIVLGLLAREVSQLRAWIVELVGQVNRVWEWSGTPRTRDSLTDEERQQFPGVATHVDYAEGWQAGWAAAAAASDGDAIVSRETTPDPGFTLTTDPGADAARRPDVGPRS